MVCPGECVYVDVRCVHTRVECVHVVEASGYSECVCGCGCAKQTQGGGAHVPRLGWWSAGGGVGLPGAWRVAWVGCVCGLRPKVSVRKAVGTSGLQRGPLIIPPSGGRIAGKGRVRC